MACEDSCLYSTFIIFTISFRGYRQRRMERVLTSRANWEKVAMKYEVEIRKTVINFCKKYSFLKLNYCIA